MNTFIIVTSAVIFNKSNGNILMAQRSMTEDVFPGLWSFPGGKLEANASLQDTLEENVRREVREEIGVEISTPQFLESHYDGKKKLYIMFLCELSSGEPQPLDETSDVKWLTFEEAQNRPLCPHVAFIIDLAKKTIMPRLITKDH